MAGEASEIPALKNLVVHVGLGQAGSTTLQQHIFNNPAFRFALLTPYEQRYNTVRKYLELPLPGDFDPGSCRRFFARRFLDFRNSELVPVISNEGLTGQNFLQMDRNLDRNCMPGESSTLSVLRRS